ncbi:MULTISPECIES: aminoacyl-tRNA hydrolase [unclassified Emticicia]|uniref:aminoacyl-tRNA hydrolase n=1 Tax=unclassified Emticicia TaxID=2627301 RepID=UPI000C75A2FB|nr:MULTISPECIES: aminoacyl-tRNA hydrolase [unclassified Emticicia]PLK46384.1 aminoacyl-tRNA hydrolase [Emticicia sp. TH156]UTA68175.1 aminoacyl-tRNA hydrolase [Emticicia sp. 21SJ11W-3]
MKYLIAGLGNIGPEYAFTRHNVGFMVLDRLAAQNNFSFKMERLAYTAEFKHKGRQIYCIKPTTYMNLSGNAVNYWLQALKIPVENLLVICDDLALPFGKLRLKTKGSHGGQNGLRNIEEKLGTQNYHRLRFGIGNDFPSGRQVNYVLEPFSEDEMSQLVARLDRADDIITSFCTIGSERTMNFFNE